MGNRLRTTYYTRKVALVETDSKANECSHLQFAAAEVGDVRSSNVEPATNTIPGTDNLQEYNIVSYTMLGNKRYVRYNHGTWALEYVYNPEGYIRYYGPEEHYSFYYIKDHLGNIRETYVYPEPLYKECIQRMQYYPSGLPWNTNQSASEQPFKYGGKEFVEMHGLDEYDSEARWYYPAIMRTTSMDPLCEKYYSSSPYAWCGNNPVKFVDLHGDTLEAWFWLEDKVAERFTFECINNQWGFYNASKKLYTGEDPFARELSLALCNILEGDVGVQLVNAIVKSSNCFRIIRSNDINYASIDQNSEKGILWNPSRDYLLEDSKIETYRPAYIGLSHELAHLYDYVMGTYNPLPWVTLSDGTDIPYCEQTAVFIENLVRSEHGLPLRTFYGLDMGVPFGSSFSYRPNPLLPLKYK